MLSHVSDMLSSLQEDRYGKLISHTEMISLNNGLGVQSNTVRACLRYFSPLL